MNSRPFVRTPLPLIPLLGVLLVSAPAVAFAQTADASTELRTLAEQNRQLQQQVQAQQKLIEKLSAEMAEMRQATDRQGRELQDLKDSANAGNAAAEPVPTTAEATLRISGEAGLAFFRTGSGGLYPNSEFHIDDAKLFLEAKVWDDVYAVSELDLLTREASDENFHLGSLFVEFEDIGSRWGFAHAFNARIGRMAIPFGEEYQVRGIVDNPLISHSLSDIWGFDQGLELYGNSGQLSYVVAVQSGGVSRLHDYTSDKSVAGRIGYDPTRWLHLSASGMRTGDLSVKWDSLSAVWFGNGFFRSIAPLSTTTSYHAQLFEVDAKTHWKSGHLAGAAGWVSFGDNNTAAADSRRMNYSFIEGLQEIGDGFYGVVRYSTIRAPGGYPLIGFGNAGAYFYSPAAVPTTRLSRLSLGLGYRFGPPLVLKVEYSLENGRLIDGDDRDYENFFGTEVGLRF